MNCTETPKKKNLNKVGIQSSAPHSQAPTFPGTLPITQQYGHSNLTSGNISNQLSSQMFSNQSFQSSLSNNSVSNLSLSKNFQFIF